MSYVKNDLNVGYRLQRQVVDENLETGGDIIQGFTKGFALTVSLLLIMLAATALYLVDQNKLVDSVSGGTKSFLTVMSSICIIIAGLALMLAVYVWWKGRNRQEKRYKAEQEANMRRQLELEAQAKAQSGKPRARRGGNASPSEDLAVE